MATTATPRRPRTMSRDRGSVRGLGGARENEESIAGLGRDRGAAEEQYDLLTAALIGVAIGVGTTLLVRRGPAGSRALSPMLRGAAKGAEWAGGGAARLRARGARWGGGAGCGR